MMLLALFLPEMGYGYELTSGLEVGLLSMMYGGSSTWAHAECGERHTTCTFEGAMQSGMPVISPSEVLSKVTKADASPIPGSADTSESKSESGKEKEDEEEGEEEIKYYNKRGKVVGQGPRQPMRFTGVVGPAHHTSKPSAVYPCD